MDGNIPVDEPNTVKAEAVLLSSAAMERAEKVLGGCKIWRGEVRGLWGLLHRGFEIRSTGRTGTDGLHFKEKLLFDDGEVQKRSWRLFDDAEGLALDADGVTQIELGHIKDNALIFVYRLELGALTFRYRDIFRLNDDGNILNEGYVSWFMLPVMKITAIGKPA